MTGPLVLCTDGSDASLRSLRAGLALLGSGRAVDVVTVIDPPDAMLVTGTGMASGVMNPDEFDAMNEERTGAAKRLLDGAREALDLADAGAHILEGSAGPSLCEYAEQVGAAAVVLGTRGHGGIKRAVLGSVSDYVTRNATCPVVITADHDD